MKKSNDNLKYCLCIDTSSLAASVAVASFDEEGAVHLLYSAYLNDGRTHSQKILPMMDAAMTFCNMQFRDMDVFAVMNGPGSFTGLRIGISTMKALADSLDKPIVAVDTLEAMAYSAAYKGWIVPMLDARRGNVYTALFRNDNAFQRYSADTIISVEDVLRDVMEHSDMPYVLGCGVDTNRQTIQNLCPQAILALPDGNHPQAASGVQLAIRDYLPGHYTKGSDLQPNYVKGVSAQAKFG